MERRERRYELLARFGAELEALRIACGKPSYAQLRRASPALPPATVSDVINGKSVPRLEFVTAFVTSCAAHAGVMQIDVPADSLDLKVWHERWRTLQEAVRRTDASPSPEEDAATALLQRVIGELGKSQDTDAVVAALRFASTTIGRTRALVQSLAAVHLHHLLGDREAAERELHMVVQDLSNEV